MNIRFEKASLSHKDLIFTWLEEPHVKEFWDNSQAHKDDILVFMGGRQTPSSYFEGSFTYWVGALEEEPFCLVMTSDITPEADIPREWIPYLSKKGKTCSLDFMIGAKDFFGKGLAAPTLKAFTQFISKDVDPEVDTYIIDPAETNPRAKHVYEKAGFKVVDEFVQKDGFFKDIKHFLMVKRLTNEGRK